MSANEVKVLAAQLFLSGEMSEAEALREAERRLGKRATRSSSSKQAPKPRPPLTDEQKRRAAERFVWAPGDVKIIRRGKR